MSQPEAKKLRVVFMGTPDFAAESLRALVADPLAEVAAVYTQPDRPCGRGQVCTPSPVKTLALEHGFEVRQPENFKNQADIDALAALGPDLLVVAAYGLILPQAVLDVPAIMPINVHASLLPKWRGAAPIQRCLQNGDIVTGISIMKMEAGLDTGPVLLQRALRLSHQDHAGLVHDQLAVLGGLTLLEALERIRTGRYNLLPQDDALASHAPKLAKEEGRIDFSRPADKVHDQVRAMHPWPGAFFDWERGEGKTIRLTIAPGEVGRELAGGEAAPGTILGEEDGKLAIACADKAYLTEEIKPAGKKPLAPSAFVCGYMNNAC